jgi:hypothetical protein
MPDSELTPDFFLEMHEETRREIRTALPWTQGLAVLFASGSGILYFGTVRFSAARGVAEWGLLLAFVLLLVSLSFELTDWITRGSLITLRGLAGQPLTAEPQSEFPLVFEPSSWFLASRFGIVPCGFLAVILW